MTYGAYALPGAHVDGGLDNLLTSVIELKSNLTHAVIVGSLGGTLRMNSACGIAYLATDGATRSGLLVKKWPWFPI